MQLRLGLAVLMSVAGAVACQAREIQLRVAAPPECRKAASVHLELQDVEFPRNRAANVRIYAKAAEGAASNKEGEEVYVGLLAVMAESVGAEGVRKGPAMRVDVTTGFREWLAAETRSELQLTLRPFAGRKPATDLDWKVRAAALVCR